MQVYLICTDGTRFLIVRKRKFNSFWRGRDRGGASLVNQAGQYAVPGGEANGRDLEKEAMREFCEESGNGANIFDKRLKVQWVVQNRQYCALAVFFEPAFLEVICAVTKINIRPGEGAGRVPAGHTCIRDWEFDEALLVDSAGLLKTLGVEQDFEGRSELVRNARPYSQAVDWYGDMARALVALAGAGAASSSSSSAAAAAAASSSGH